MGIKTDSIVLVIVMPFWNLITGIFCLDSVMGTFWRVMRSFWTVMHSFLTVITSFLIVVSSFLIVIGSFLTVVTSFLTVIGSFQKMMVFLQGGLFEYEVSLLNQFVKTNCNEWKVDRDWLGGL